jgi:hypothetical protein
MSAPRIGTPWDRRWDSASARITVPAARRGQATTLRPAATTREGQRPTVLAGSEGMGGSAGSSVRAFRQRNHNAGGRQRTRNVLASGRNANLVSEASTSRTGRRMQPHQFRVPP